jgi:two-component system, chemotaxis family, protein-glutamate methylesterase/glutaminase
VFVSARDIIVMGASSGGIEAFIEIVSGLPHDLPAAIFVVLHVSPRGTTKFPEILSRAGSIPAAHACDQGTIRPGRIYVAPPDFHLLLRNGTMRLVRGPKENNVRPAIDATFRTAARTYGPRVVGVVLSGALDDGTAGLAAIEQRGGIALVQDPKDALFPDMPRSAMEAVKVDYCLPTREIAPLLVRLAHEPVKDAPPVSEEMEKESKIEAMDMDTIDDEDKPGTPSVFGCPDCGGVLWELQDGELLRFRCRVGHAYGTEGLLAAQSESLDTALWSAFRALEENAALCWRLAKQARQNQRTNSAKMFEDRAKAVEDQAKVIRQILLTEKNESPADLADKDKES